MRPVIVSARLRSKIDPEDIHQEAIVKVLTSASERQRGRQGMEPGYLKAARRSSLLNADREFGYAVRDDLRRGPAG